MTFSTLCYVSKVTFFHQNIHWPLSVHQVHLTRGQQSKRIWVRNPTATANNHRNPIVLFWGIILGFWKRNYRTVDKCLCNYLAVMSPSDIIERTIYVFHRCHDSTYHFWNPYKIVLHGIEGCRGTRSLTNSKKSLFYLTILRVTMRRSKLSTNGENLTLLLLSPWVGIVQRLHYVFLICVIFNVT